MKDDGNVCCPSSEVEHVFLSKGRATKYCEEMNSKASTYPYKEARRYYEEHDAT